MAKLYKKLPTKINKKDVLIKILSEMNLDFYESLDDLTDESSIQLKNLDDFFRFIKNHNIDTVFYYYFYANAECLQINEDTFNELKIEDEVINIIQEQVDEYNHSILSLDF